MKIHFTSGATVEFLSAIAYIRQDRPMAAQRFRDRAYEVLRRLEEHPASGRVIPEFPDLRHREVLVSPYRFFYRVEGDTVWIVGVWHGARIPEPPTP